MKKLNEKVLEIWNEDAESDLYMQSLTNITITFCHMSSNVI